jgi:hypothetical protein
MKLIVSIIFIAVCLCGPLLGSKDSTNNDGKIYYQMENGRFYSSALLETEGVIRVVAVGQRTPAGKRGKRQGYIAILVQKGNTLEVEAEELFKVTFNDRKWPTRVRTVAVVKQGHGKSADIYLSGRSGSDEEGIGFLRQYVWANNTLTHMKTITMHHKQEGLVYTHGYSLKTGDIDGDGIQEVIYGGFFGKSINEHLSEDFADVQIFKKNVKGIIERSSIKPFQKLQIPLRVNAMEVKDLDGDSKAEIIIVGRSRQGDQQFSSFAIWSNGQVSYHVNKDQSLPGRFRTVLALDIDGDGKDELITGGRIDMGERMVADLQVWKIKKQSVTMIARYNWTSDSSTLQLDF